MTDIRNGKIMAVAELITHAEWTALEAMARDLDAIRSGGKPKSERKLTAQVLMTWAEATRPDGARQ